MLPFFKKLISFALDKSWSPSSMDRMKDSGSFDMGSSPVGITKINNSR